MTKQIEAMKLALEALEGVWKGGFSFPHVDQIREAITALREALANEALDKMAENARELGLDYEPAQQEPVAWLHKVTKLMVHADEIAKTSRNEDRINSGEFQALYTSPPAGKPWVGLTPEDKVEILRANGEAAVLILTEAKLKEKNT